MVESGSIPSELPPEVVIVVLVIVTLVSNTGCTVQTLWLVRCIPLIVTPVQLLGSIKTGPRGLRRAPTVDPPAMVPPAWMVMF